MGRTFEGRSLRVRPSLSREAGRGLCLLENFFRFELGGDPAFNVL